MTVVHSLLAVLNTAQLLFTCKFGTLKGSEIKVCQFSVTRFIV